MTDTQPRRLLRIEARNAETPIERKPAWIKTKAVMGPEYRDMQSRVKGGGLHGTRRARASQICNPQTEVPSATIAP